MFTPHHPEKADLALQKTGKDALASPAAPHSLSGRALFALGSVLVRAGRSLQQSACREPEQASQPTFTITL